jgi:hypothetical protein
MPTPKTITADEPYLIQTECPVCGQTDSVKVVIQSHLSTTAEGGYVGVKLKQMKVEHDCKQHRLVVLAEDLSADGYSVSMFSDMSSDRG